STSVFAEMANNRVNLQKIIKEFIISTYVLKDSYSQDSTQIRSELVKQFDIDIPEAIVRTQLKKLIKDDILQKIGGEYVINANDRNERSYISNDLDEKKTLHSGIVRKLIEFVQLYKGKLSEEDKLKVENSFIEYLFDNTKEDGYSALISAFIVKNEKEVDFLKELNLIR